MHITNLYVLVSMHTVGHHDGLEAMIRDLHAVANGYESWAHCEADGGVRIDPSVLDPDHTRFEITLKCEGEIGGQLRYRFWYEAPGVGSYGGETKRMTIYTDLNGLIANVELDNV